MARFFRRQAYSHMAAGESCLQTCPVNTAGRPAMWTCSERNVVYDFQILEPSTVKKCYFCPAGQVPAEPRRYDCLRCQENEVSTIIKAADAKSVTPRLWQNVGGGHRLQDLAPLVRYLDLATSDHTSARPARDRDFLLKLEEQNALLRNSGIRQNDLPRYTEFINATLVEKVPNGYGNANNNAHAPERIAERKLKHYKFMC